MRLHPLSCDCDYRIRWQLSFSITLSLLSPQFICCYRGGPRHMNTYRHTLVTSLLANAAECRSDVCLRVERISGGLFRYGEADIISCRCAGRHTSQIKPARPPSEWRAWSRGRGNLFHCLDAESHTQSHRAADTSCITPASITILNLLIQRTKGHCHTKAGWS
jgi:hypothetical protein